MKRFTERHTKQSYLRLGSFFYESHFSSCTINRRQKSYHVITFLKLIIFFKDKGYVIYRSRKMTPGHHPTKGYDLAVYVCGRMGDGSTVRNCWKSNTVF